MHESGRGPAALIYGLLKRVEDEVGDQGRGNAPPDDTSGKDVNHKRDVREAAPRRDVGEIRDPELIRPTRGEVSINQVTRAIRVRPRLRGGRPCPAAHRARQTHLAHQAPDPAPRGSQILAAHLLRPSAAHTPDDAHSKYAG